MEIKYVYIVLAHKNPLQVRRLLNCLSSNNVEVGFWIHVDKRVPSRDFHHALADIKNLFWVPPIATRWGSFNLVKAVLWALQDIEKQCKFYSHVILISGQDFPINYPDKIYEFLDRHPGRSFIEYQPLPVDKLSYMGWDRMERWHFYFGNRKFTYPLYNKPYGIIDKAVHAILSLVLPPKRPLIKNLVYYYGSQWWVLSSKSIQYLLDYIQTHPDFIRFFRFAWISDELFFQTILLNHPDSKFRKNLVNDNLRYINWNKPDQRPPAILQKEDFENIISSGKFYARKFDSLLDEEIIRSLIEFQLKKDI